MSSKNANEPIENAEEIIERFGGIRPMASKIDVAVTTVQGWKKRNTIPANRFDLITSTAAAHDIDLSDLLGAAANVNVQAAEADFVLVESKEDDAPAPAKARPVRQPEQPLPRNRSVTQAEDESSSVIAALMHDDIIQLIKQAERRAVTKSMVITLILMALILGAFVLVLSPETKAPFDFSEAQRQEQLAQISATQGELAAVTPPAGLQAGLAALKEQVIAAGNSAVDAAVGLQDAAADVSGDLLGGNVEALKARLGDASLVENLSQRYGAYMSSAGGQDLLAQSTGDLFDALRQVGSNDPAVIEAALIDARDQSPALSQSLEAVPAQDVKAAALLLTMAQMRSALNRENEPFTQDLAVLMSLVGSDDPALTDSLQRLAPHAERGVLTPEGLSNELRSLTGDIVVASLQGQDVSVEELAKARMDAALQGGEAEGGVLPVETELSQASALLNAGDIKGAISLVQGLDGDAASIAGPWLSKARAALTAQQVQNTFSQVLSVKDEMPAEMITDPVSGMQMLKPAGVSAFKPSKSLNIQ